MESHRARPRALITSMFSGFAFLLSNAISIRGAWEEKDGGRTSQIQLVDPSSHPLLEPPSNRPGIE